MRSGSRIVTGPSGKAMLDDSGLRMRKTFTYSIQVSTKPLAQRPKTDPISRNRKAQEAAVAFSDWGAGSSSPGKSEDESVCRSSSTRPSLLSSFDDCSRLARTAELHREGVKRRRN